MVSTIIKLWLRGSSVGMKSTTINHTEGIKLMVCSKCSDSQPSVVTIGLTYKCSECNYQITNVSVVEKRKLPVDEDLVDFITKVRNGEIAAEHIEMTELPTIW